MAGRRFFITTALFILPVLTTINGSSTPSGKQASDSTSVSDADLKSLSLVLERIGCFGTCPAYTLTIHGDGNVEYIGKSNVKLKGTHKSQIETSVIRNLMSEFARSKFLTLPEYSEEKCTGQICTDMPTAITELQMKGVTHGVRHYYGCRAAPKALFELESAIDKAANSEQ
jgi:uncharacterized protein DUF6438